MSYAVQSRNSIEQNKLFKEDLSVHDWYRFILSFPPHLVRTYLKKFDINSSQRILDPFCGTGTTLVECKKLGISSIGLEANPVVHFATKTKTNWDINTKSLISHSTEIVANFRERINNYGDLLKQLSPEKEKLLIKNSISPIPLHKSLLLLEVIEELFNINFNDHQLLAFAKQLVFSFSNLRFGPEIGVSRTKIVDVRVIELWSEQIKKIATDINNFSFNKHIPSSVYLVDSRSLGDKIDDNSIDAVITSPPYPNEKDYSRTTRLESVLLGFINTKADLQKFKKTLIRSNTRNIYKDDNDYEWISEYKNILTLANTIENKRIELGKTSGFERMYHKVVLNYFGGMARHLDNLKRVLKPGAKLAYVVGDQASYFRTPIRTGTLIAEIAQNLGYKLIQIDLFRTRKSTITKNELREEVVLLKWDG